MEMPGAYVLDSIWLGKRLNGQRRVQLGERGEKQLTSEHIENLNAFGMCWESRTEVNNQIAWDKR